jgi:hypothetical protein
MRRTAALLLAVPVCLSAQAPLPDDGRLDATWFGPAAAFQASKTLGFQWLKTGLDLRHRSLRLKVWEPAAWLLGKRATKDQLVLERLEESLLPELARGLQKGLKGALPVSRTEGDLILVGRVVDAVGEESDSMSSGPSSLSLDLKLVDADSGELLGAFHTTLRGPGTDLLVIQYSQWCEHLGQLLAPLARHLPVAAAVPPGLVRPTPPVAAPAFDLEGALRRIEGLKRDGLLTEAECQVLRLKAADRAK